MHDRVPEIAVTRRERKRRTRQALLDAALGLLEDHSFSSLSLRQVTRAAGIVPTAFYRHFDGMEELGLAIVDESFRTLRAVLREARTGERGDGQVVRTSVALLARHVRAQKGHFRFVARERFGGVAALRHAIRREIRMLASELAIDLARFPMLERWSGRDLQILAGLMVNAMVSVTEALLDAPPDDPAAEDEILATAETQLRMVLVGVPHWRSAPG